QLHFWVRISHPSYRVAYSLAVCIYLMWVQDLPRRTSDTADSLTPNFAASDRPFSLDDRISRTASSVSFAAPCFSPARSTTPARPFRAMSLLFSRLVPRNR